MRLSELCASATTFPTIIESTASTATIGCHTSVNAGKASVRTRTSATKAAVFTPVAMKPVIGVGDPS